MTPKHSISRLLSTCFLLFIISQSRAAVVQMDFSIGSQPGKQIFVELLDLPFPDGAPKTVENFLRYIEYQDPDTNEAVRRYDNTIIHRNISGFIIQGGSFAYTPNPGGEDFARDMSEVVIDKTADGQDKTVKNEFDVSRSNVRGTVAMAKLGGNPDSATSGWFINLGDNSANLDNQNGGFTVFGRVIGMTADNIGTTVADEIAALDTVNKTDVHNAFSDLPLFGYTQGDPVPQVTSSNLVRLTSVTIVEPVQPSVLDMGLTPLNSTSPTQTVTLQNLTDTTFTISEFAPNLLASPFSLSSETCSAATLLPLQTCTLFIDFTPTEAGQKNASFSVTTDSPTLSSLPVSITGTGAPQAPTISFSPQLGPTLQFGSLGPDQDDKVFELTISSLGIDVLTVDQFDPSPFTGTGTENLALSSDCSSLATGKSCTVSITFSLVAKGIETEAQFEIRSNDPNAPGSIIQITGSTSSDNDGVSDAIEAAVSSTGDGNLDGIADILQDNVTSLPNILGDYVTLETEPGIQLAGVAAIESPAPETTPVLASGTLDFNSGFFSFHLENVPVGGTATVTLYLPEGQTATNYFKFGRLPSDIITRFPTLIARPPHWYSFDYNGDTGAEILGNRIVLHFRDGDRGDDDLTADGHIADPGGPAVASASSGSSGGGGGGGCSLSTARDNGKSLPVDFVLLLISLFTLRHLRKRCPVH